MREAKRVIPSVTHVDYSARIQTVTRDSRPLYYDLIEAFEKVTGVPVIINTSFNVRSEPIVCSPHDAYLCFMRTNMDHLVLGHHLLDRRTSRPCARTWTGEPCSSRTRHSRRRPIGTRTQPNLPLIKPGSGHGIGRRREKMGILGELWLFMKVRKKWWLGPIVLMLALLGLLVVFTQGSAVAPFIYTLF